MTAKGPPSMRSRGDSRSYNGFVFSLYRVVCHGSRYVGSSDRRTAAVARRRSRRLAAMGRPRCGAPRVSFG
ncbi:hypothetical protein ES288_D01G100200v1 [Gossypium darwinii]|uniref:Uncharacterized protein n=1 Tax=Gossypium darwinii TaxID=34276 RepID=A0A5D2DND4_GOSDA|nr:hypothetical protein ES288_D01G100200v1 [Gossypium darwinii]